MTFRSILSNGLAFALLAVRDLSETKLRKLRSGLLALRPHE